MSGTQSSSQNSSAALSNASSAAISNASTSALISEVASAAASTAAAHSSLPTQSVNIKSLIPITLDMESTSYRHWRNTFRIVLGRFDLLSHITANTPRPNDAA
jgi:hypothetical protein